MAAGWIKNIIGARLQIIIIMIMVIDEGHFGIECYVWRGNSTWRCTNLSSDERIYAFSMQLYTFIVKITSISA